MKLTLIPEKKPITPPPPSPFQIIFIICIDSLFSTNKILFSTIILVFLFNISSYGQIECGTPSNSPNIDYGSIISERGVFQPNPGSYCINVLFHIVRQTNGSGGFDANEIDNLVDLLNDSFNPHNIFIVSSGVNFINNSDYYNTVVSYSGQNQGFNTSLFGNSANNSVNFYLVNSIRETNYPTDIYYEGIAQKIESKNLIVKNEKVLTSTSTHELGHCLNLFHTFKGTAIGTTGCAEAIDGSNCQECGDYICDTPADNNTGNNGGYSPDLTNVMSYYSTREYFSFGQGQRMRDALQESSILQDIIGSNSLCGLASKEGDSIICSDQGTVIEIINAEPPYNWSVTTNLIITQNNGNSITVQANDYHASETGTIWVSHHGVGQNPLKIDVWLGKPQGPVSIYGPDEVNSGAIVSYQGGVAEGATSYLWWLPLSI